MIRQQNNGALILIGLSMLALLLLWLSIVMRGCEMEILALTNTEPIEFRIVSVPIETTLVTGSALEVKVRGRKLHLLGGEEDQAFCVDTGDIVQIIWPSEMVGK